MFRRGRWDDYTEEELLKLLKEELDRVGLTEKPSRTEFQKVYERTNIPSPSWYVEKFGSWKEIMNRIGLKYDDIKRNNRAASGKIKENVKWRDVPEKEIIDIVVLEMRRTSETRGTYYNKVRDHDTTPSLETLVKRNIKWKDVKKAYAYKYGDMK